MPGLSLVKGVFKPPNSVSNICEDLVSQYGPKVGFLRPTQVNQVTSKVPGSGVLSRCFRHIDCPLTGYFGHVGTTQMHFANYIVLGLLIACMLSAAAMVLSRAKKARAL